MNWFLFYRATEFAEVLTVESSAFRRTGEVSTWGTSKRIECATAAEALSASKRAREEFERDGFVLTRAWRFDADEFDFALLAVELHAATKKCLSRLFAQQPDTNAFALLTDESAMTIGAISHRFPSIADAKDDLRWNPNEWATWDKSSDFDIVYRLMLSQSRDDLSRVEFGEYRRVFEHMAMHVLEKLKSEGAFGTREVVLLLHTSGSGAADAAVISRLNGDAFGARYRKWLASWQ